MLPKQYCTQTILPVFPEQYQLMFLAKQKSPRGSAEFSGSIQGSNLHLDRFASHHGKAMVSRKMMHHSVHAWQTSTFFGTSIGSACMTCIRGSTPHFCPRVPGCPTKQPTIAAMLPHLVPDAETMMSESVAKQNVQGR